MTAIRAVLFDKDGTLFDFQASWGNFTHGFIAELAGGDAGRAAALAEAFGFDNDARQFRPDSAVIAGTVDDMIASVLTVLPAMSAQDVLARIITGSSDAPQVPAAPLLPLLTGLRDAGLPLGLATNDAEIPARAHLRAHGIEGLFDFVAGFDSGFGAKPAPDMLLAFSTATGIAPRAIAMVGDSTHDLHAARDAGMVRVAVLTGVATADDLSPHADVVLPSIADLPGWLDTRNATPAMSQTAMP